MRQLRCTHKHAEAHRKGYTLKHEEPVYKTFNPGERLLPKAEEEEGDCVSHHSCCWAIIPNIHLLKEEMPNLTYISEDLDHRQLVVRQKHHGRGKMLTSWQPESRGREQEGHKPSKDTAQ